MLLNLSKGGDGCSTATDFHFLPLDRHVDLSQINSSKLQICSHLSLGIIMRLVISVCDESSNVLPTFSQIDQWKSRILSLFDGLNSIRLSVSERGASSMCGGECLSCESGQKAMFTDGDSYYHN